MGEKPKKKKSDILKILLIMLILAAVIVVCSLAVKNGFSGLWRSITGKSGSLEFFYENAAGGDFCDLDGGLAVASQSGVTVFDEKGAEVFARLVSCKKPALSSAGKYGVFYDIGGTSAVFFSVSGEICRINASNEIISASVNEKGYMCLCTGEDVYLGSVTVYNSAGTDIYKMYSGAGRILSADVLGKELFVLTAHEGGSTLLKYSLTAEEEQGRFTLSGLAIDAAAINENIALITTDSVVFVTPDMEEVGAFDFSGKFLHKYSVGDYITVLSLREYQMSGESTIVSLNENGETLGSASSEGEVLGLDAGKDAFAVLYSETVTVYNPDMTKKALAESSASAQKVLMRNDGCVTAAGPFSAKVHGLSEEKAVTDD